MSIKEAGHSSRMPQQDGVSKFFDSRPADERPGRERPGGRPRGLAYISHSVIVVPLLLVVFIFGTLMAGDPRVAPTYAAPNGLVPFPDTISAVIAHSHLQGAADPNQRISLSIGLRPRDADGLKRYVQDITRPTSVNYHRYLTPAQVADVFGPDKATYGALLQFLQASGFTITTTYRHRLLITFSGTVAQVEQVFHVSMNTYSAPDGHVFYANTSDPVLPTRLVGAVQSISGLNNAVRLRHAALHTHNRSFAALRMTNNTKMTNNTVSCLGHGNNYFTPDQTASAYNLNGLYNAGYRGEGQTIALFELDTFQMSDLTIYVSCYGHGHTAIQTIMTGTGKVPTDEGVAEVELDAELVLSAAPQLGILKIYEAANDQFGFADYNAEWARIVQDAPPVVSTSWGACEQDIGLQEAQQENIFFMTAAAQGQSIFAASGDSGSSGCAFDQPSSNVLNAGDPGAQPFVTGVGGTTLTMNGSSYGSETSWNNQYGASGGGISQFWPSPAWQNAPGVINTFSTGAPCGAQSGICRETPDVSLDADPATGYLIYCTSPAVSFCKNGGPWVSVGGTSAAAPMWAAMMALTNEMSLKMGNFNLGFVNPLLYQVGSNGANYAASFHDITFGTNDYNNLHAGDYPATANYDMATGLGSYNAFALAQNLVLLAQGASGPRSSPVSKTWYFAEGSVGGGFQEYLTIQNPSATQDATVSIIYLFESQSSVTVTHTVPLSTRATINVNQDLGISPSAPQQAISAIVQVTNGPGIVVERPMYFNFKGIQSGTDAPGATAPGTSYYFPEGDTRQAGRNYYTYITMLNPSATQTATATVTFYTGACGLSGQPVCTTQTMPVAPLHRGTVIPPWNVQMAITVTTDLPMVVERPMYFRDTIPNAGGLTTGAASEIGAAAPGNDWLFAEGYTGPNFQEYFELANFAATGTSVTITLEYSNGHTQAIQVTVPALGLAAFDLNAANAHPYGTCDIKPCAPTSDVSAEITSTGPIVADRLMYFHYGANHFSGGTETVGEAGPASHNVYAFAEGYTANTFQEYLTLQNSTSTVETVAVTLFADTYVIQQQVTVKAHSRYTIGINGLIVPIAQAYNNMGSNSYAVSMTVQVLGTGSKIVAERPMYFNYFGDQGGTDVIGYTGG